MKGGVTILLVSVLIAVSYGISPPLSFIWSFSIHQIMHCYCVLHLYHSHLPFSSLFILHNILTSSLAQKLNIMPLGDSITYGCLDGCGTNLTNPGCMACQGIYTSLYHPILLPYLPLSSSFYCLLYCFLLSSTLTLRHRGTVHLKTKCKRMSIFYSLLLHLFLFSLSSRFYYPPSDLYQS